MFEINYSLSGKALRNVELIAEVNGYLHVLKMNPDWSALLERKAGIAEAVSSIGIEGTVLTLDQAKAITVGEEDLSVGEKERREFISYFSTLDFVKQHINDELNLSLLLQIHERVTQGDIEAHPGKIRSDLRGIKRDEKIVYTAPPPEHLKELLGKFLEWFSLAAKDRELSPVVAAGICHFWFVWIHPFCDGNGRVARLLTTFILLKKKSEGIKYFALSDYYNREKERYYNALQETNICKPELPALNFSHPLSRWLTFFIESYKSQMGSIKEVTDRILQLNIRVEHLRREGMLSDSHNKVLGLLFSREKASYKELAAYLGKSNKPVSSAYVNQVLKPLRTSHILIEQKIGAQLWFSLGSPEDEADESVFKKKLKVRKPVEKRQKARKNQPTLPIFG